MLSVATNTGALMAKAAASSVNRDMETAMQRLSSGKRINAARDDAAGMAISSRLESSVRGLNQSIRNALDGQALIDTAEGAMQEQEEILQRIRELAVQSANDTNSENDRAALDNEAQLLLKELNGIAGSTTWAGQKLLDGTFTDKKLQVGGGTMAVDQLTTSIVGSHVVDLFSVPAQEFENGTFDSYSVDGSGNLTVPGWTIFENQVKLGYDNTNGSSTIGGFSTPIDPTPRPTNVGGQTSRGDNYSPSSATYDTSMENGALRLVSSMTTAAGGDVVHGPYIVSDNSAYIAKGATVKFDWQAKGGSDAFDVFAYLLDVDTGETQTLLNETGGSTGASTNLATEEITVNSSGNYKFVFISGTFDYSFGRAAGASLYVDNIKIENNRNDPTITHGALDLTTARNSADAIKDVDGALKILMGQRSVLGSLSNRLDHIVANNTNISVNIAASIGRIEDADFAVETTNLAKTQILQQASTAMLAQANAAKQNVLSLLQG